MNFRLVVWSFGRLVVSEARRGGEDLVCAGSALKAQQQPDKGRQADREKQRDQDFGKVFHGMRYPPQNSRLKTQNWK